VLLTLAGAALLMGLAGGPHCAAMCGPACAGVIRIVRPGEKLSGAKGTWQFHAGRLTGYSLLGGVVAEAVQAFGWLATQSAALRPAWTLMHVAVLGWGLALLLLARQPTWVTDAGRTVWSRVRPLAAKPGGAFVAGGLWAFMPCGLLYSALLVASLSGGFVAGALSMALFAAGSAVSLALAPLLLDKLGQKDWSTRISGLLLVVAAVWALWMDVIHKIAVWCGLV
jgi:sulfite exporter TauE/SafE